MIEQFFQQSSEWGRPIFKILAHNDTGAASGNQAGVLIPTDIRKYFPTLSGAGSSLNPTIDQRINAQLFIEDKFLGAVSTRYQFQTWAGTRTPEARITDELGPMRDSAEQDDILIIQRSVIDELSYRLTLVRKKSAFYQTVFSRTHNRRWGELN